MKDGCGYGARMERGRVTSVTVENGIRRYGVESLDRPGIRAPGILALSGTYAAGDAVYFFIFGDGNGLIVAGI